MLSPKDYSKFEYDGSAMEGRYLHLQLTPEEWRTLEQSGDIPPERHWHLKASSPLLALLPDVSWPWVPACGSLEPPRQDGENAQKTGKNGGKMGETRSKTCEQARDRRDQLDAPSCRSCTQVQLLSLIHI